MAEMAAANAALTSQLQQLQQQQQAATGPVPQQGGRPDIMGTSLPSAPDTITDPAASMVPSRNKNSMPGFNAAADVSSGQTMAESIQQHHVDAIPVNQQNTMWGTPDVPDQTEKPAMRIDSISAAGGYTSDQLGFKYVPTASAEQQQVSANFPIVASGGDVVPEPRWQTPVSYTSSRPSQISIVEPQRPSSSRSRSNPGTCQSVTEPVSIAQALPNLAPERAALVAAVLAKQKSFASLNSRGSAQSSALPSPAAASDSIGNSGFPADKADILAAVLQRQRSRSSVGISLPSPHDSVSNSRRFSSGSGIGFDLGPQSADAAAVDAVALQKQVSLSAVPAAPSSHNLFQASLANVDASTAAGMQLEQLSHAGGSAVTPDHVAAANNLSQEQPAPLVAASSNLPSSIGLAGNRTALVQAILNRQEPQCRPLNAKVSAAAYAAPDTTGSVSKTTPITAEIVSSSTGAVGRVVPDRAALVAAVLAKHRGRSK